jgi:hypothetical protein
MWIVPSNHPLRQSLSAQVFVESKEALNELSDLNTSLMWRSKPLSLKIWSRKWNVVYWLPLLFGRTLKHSHANHFEGLLTSYLQDTHANHFQPQDEEKELTTHGIYTPTLKGQFGLFDHESAFSKTSGDTLHAASLKSSPRWRDWVTECIGEYTRRRKRARRIREKEYSSWPTPDCSDRRSDKSNQVGLSNAVNWPTPRTTDERDNHGELEIGKNGGMYRKNSQRGANLSDTVKNWPTPTTMENEHDPETLKARAARLKARNNGKNGTKHSGNGCGPNLATEVKVWPTPRASANENRTTKPAPSHGKTHGKLLAAEVASFQDLESLNRHGNIRGSYPERLNPLWVCQLMGTTFEKTFFVHLETPSTLTQQSSHSGTY